MSEQGTQNISDEQWFAQQVTVQVDRDNRAWLDTLLEMKQKELQDFAIYRYQVPEAAALSVDRNSLVQLVVMANKAGGGGSVLRTRFRYLNHLKGIVPQFTQKVRGGRYLYLTRGEGDSMQVFDKSTGKWVSARTGQTGDGVGRSVAPELTPSPTEQGPAHQEPAPAINTGEIVADAVQQTLKLVVPALPKMTRPMLEDLVRQLGQDDTSEDKFPTNADLIQFVRNAAGVVAETPAPTTTNPSEGDQNNGQNSNGNN